MITFYYRVGVSFPLCQIKWSASHHHLNVLALFLLLRRRTRLGRHDGRAKTCRPGGDSDTVRTGHRLFLPGADEARRTKTCSSASPRSTQTFWPWPPPRKSRRGQTSSAQKLATIRRLNLKKEDDLRGQWQSGAQGIMGPRVVNVGHGGARPGGKAGGAGWCKLSVVLCAAAGRLLGPETATSPCSLGPARHQSSEASRFLQR